jgi:RHS repeat-associated protein
LTYDLRGNITTLKRNGLNSNGWTGNNFVAGTYGIIDNLTYTYNTKNQLLSVNEASLPTRGFKTNPTATGNQYGYDGNGNLIYDKNKYITSIEYNYLNLPIKVVIDNPTDAVNSGSIEFIYDATGTKLRKTVKNKDGSVKETWDYVNGVEYKNQILQRVAHSEGAVVRNDFGQYQHEYVLRDHLGNTRVTFTDGVNKGEPYWNWSNYTYIVPDNTGYDDGVVTEADIKHINHTYPFGMAMEGNWNNAGSANNNRYLYNGKQWNDDFGMGWYDYGARFYDPAVGRWFAIDPSAEKDYDWTPYVYVYNNPVKLVDPDGREAAYPIVTITAIKDGTTDAKVLGYVKEGTTTKTDLYKATVTDTEDPNFKMEFTVTRDAWAVTEADAGTGTMSNVSFEPKDPNQNHYTAKAQYNEYPKGSGSGVPGLKLTQKGSEEMHAAPRPASVSLGYRTKVAVATGVMMHVAGHYKTAKGTQVAGSEGCFGVAPKGNSAQKPSNPYAAKVINTIISQAKKSKVAPGKIEVILKPRPNAPTTRTP